MYAATPAPLVYMDTRTLLSSSKQGDAASLDCSLVPSVYFHTSNGWYTASTPTPIMAESVPFWPGQRQVGGLTFKKGWLGSE